MTPDQIITAKRAWKRGRSLRLIALDYGLSRHGLQALIDPKYRGHRNEMERRRHMQASEAVDHTTSKATKSDIAARLAEVPEDDRSLTGRLMGDPIRSALGREGTRP